MQLSITLVGAREYIVKVGALPPLMQARILKATWVLALALKAKIVTEKLQGQVLGMITRNLIRSIFADVAETPQLITGHVGSAGVAYAAIHEFGGKTPAHEIVPRKAQALRFLWHGREVFFKRVSHPGSVMPERSYIRSSLSEMEARILTTYSEAMQGALTGAPE